MAVRTTRRMTVGQLPANDLIRDVPRLSSLLPSSQRSAIAVKRCRSIARYQRRSLSPKAAPQQKQQGRLAPNIASEDVSPDTNPSPSRLAQSAAVFVEEVQFTIHSQIFGVDEAGETGEMPNAALWDRTAAALAGCGYQPSGLVHWR